MAEIVEASQDYLERLFIENDRHITTRDPFARRGFWIRHRNGESPFEPQGFAIGASLPAEVFEGQWIVRCDGCPNSQFTARHDKRFFCVNCLNAQHGGQWVKVTWPRKVADIEAVLLSRRNFKDRNYEKGETVASLIADSRENRDPVPEGLI